MKKASKHNSKAFAKAYNTTEKESPRMIWAGALMVRLKNIIAKATLKKYLHLTSLYDVLAIIEVEPKVNPMESNATTAK
jgi:type III secretion system FlhB-like substrate exporter